MDEITLKEEFVTDLTGHYEYDEEEANELWEMHKEELIDDLWEEFSFYLSEKIGVKGRR